MSCCSAGAWSSKARISSGEASAYACRVSIRVVLADDSYIVREGIEQLLEAGDELDLVASCADRDSLLDAVEREQPDVVLTDIRMPPSASDEGIQVASLLRRDHPDVGVVVLSQYSDPIYALRLLDEGSEGRAYLLKERVHSRQDLVAAIQAVAEGGSVIDPKVVERLVEAKRQAERSPLAELTPREVEVLAGIAEGKSNLAIAEDLVLTKRAVEKRINSIFLKLGFTHSPEQEEVSKRVKAALIFLAEEGSRPPSGEGPHPGD
jgi:DNA-binding NarL/FixJ family response regulator